MSKKTSPRYKNNLLSKSDIRSIRPLLEQTKWWDGDELWSFLDNFKKTHPHLVKLRAEQAKNPQPLFFEPRLLEQSEMLLAKAGFVKFHQNISARIAADSFQYRDMEWDDVHQWWAHPAGVLVSLDSCGQEDGHYRYNSISVHVQVDEGIYGPLTHLAHSSLQGVSGGSESLPGGNNIYKGWCQCNRDVSELVTFLEDIQKVGRLLPFDQWDPRQGPLSGVHDWLPSTDPRSPLFELRQRQMLHPTIPARQLAIEIQDDPLVGQRMAEGFWEHVFAVLPTFDAVFPGLSSVMAASAYHPLSLAPRGPKKVEEGYNPETDWKLITQTAAKKWGVEFHSNRHQSSGPFLSPASPHRRDWLRVDEARRAHQTLASHALIRYTSSADRALLASWQGVLMRVVGEKSSSGLTDEASSKPLFINSVKELPENGIDWNTVDYASVSEVSATLPGLLIEEAMGQANAARAFVELLNHAPPSLVQGWCTTPDAQGMTLPLRIFHACLDRDYGQSINCVLLYLDEVLESLSQKCPAQQWVMETDKTSPYGIWFQYMSGADKHRPLCDFDVCQEIMQRYVQAGAPWPTSWVWTDPLTVEDGRRHPFLVPAKTHLHQDVQSVISSHPQTKLTPHLERELLARHTDEYLEDKQSRRRAKI